MGTSRNIRKTLSRRALEHDAHIRRAALATVAETRRRLARATPHTIRARTPDCEIPGELMQPDGVRKPCDPGVTRSRSWPRAPPLARRASERALRSTRPPSHSSVITSATTGGTPSPCTDSQTASRANLSQGERGGVETSDESMEDEDREETDWMSLMGQLQSMDIDR